MQNSERIFDREMSQLAEKKEQLQEDFKELESDSDQEE
jgi:hypothetical protein